jgi:hypothetical protein
MERILIGVCTFIIVLGLYFTGRITFVNSGMNIHFRDIYFVLVFGIRLRSPF